MGDLYGNLACGENSRACRWKMPRWRESLSDGFAANANPIVRRAHESTRTQGNLACGENSRALRLENVLLRKPLSDLQAANANPIVRGAHEMGSRRVTKKRME